MIGLVFLVMRCCVTLFQPSSLRCSPSKMAAGESDGRSACSNLSGSGSGSLGNARRAGNSSNSARSANANHLGSGASGSTAGCQADARAVPGRDTNPGTDTALTDTPSPQNRLRQTHPQNNACRVSATAGPGRPSSLPAASLPSSPASVLVYREPVYNWQATKSTVKERFAFLFNNEVLSDVQFLVGKGMGVQRIPAHRYDRDLVNRRC